ncbi:MAG: PD40 domain-containing protein [Phycisphaerales bacterium]|nr:MAG: PD40 domain-containing protein [Phycisphaerales bacterium]
MLQSVMREMVILAAVFACGCAVRAQSHLMRYADVHKDNIVFTYEGDLWLVPSRGGDARRVTSDPGSETWAKFSPDGRYIAFTGQYDGGRDVYVMDARGGVPKRLTYHPSGDRVLGWFPDGKHVLFRSRREYPTRADMIYKISVDGGMPVKLPVDRAGLTALSPDAKQIAYNRISREARTWKRHQGGTAQDIWLGSLEKGDFHKITDWPGTDNFPMWHGNSIYFTSDRKFGTLNIYKYDLTVGKITPVTSYRDYDVKYPSTGPNQIVYQYGESLHSLDIDSGKTRLVSVNVPSDLVRMRPESVKVAPRTGSFGLSPSGKRMLLEARGEILNLPVKDGEPINLTKTSETREKNAVWSPDGRWVAFTSDRTGEEEVYLVDQKGEKPWRQLTKGGLGFRMQPVWSPDSKHLLFSDKFLRLNLVVAETGAIAIIDQGEYDDGWERWGIQDYVWSPDSEWIAYTKLEQSVYEAIFLYSMADKTTQRVTDETYPDWSPSFDPKGRYLYFLSNRDFKPVMGFVDQNHVFLDMCRPYVVVLKDDEPTPFAPKDSEEEVKEPEEEETPGEKEEEETPDKKEKEAEADKEKDGEADKPVEIDTGGIERRIVAAEGVPAGNYFRLEATDKGFLYLKKDEHEFTKYQSVTDQTGGKLDLYHYDLEEKETKKILGGIANYHLSGDGKKLVYRAGDQYGVVDTGKEVKVGDGEVKLDRVRIKIDRNQEFLQIFNEAWRVQRDWFYDPGLHGVDWKATGEKYRKFVPYCGNRSDLNYLIGEMIAELNIGHTYVGGGDIQRSPKRVPTGMLGADFDTVPGADYYRIAHIIPGRPWDESERSPLTGPGCPIKVGHFLIAIDGEEVTTTDSVFAFLQDKADAVVTLTYNDKPTAEDAKTCRVKTIRSESAIRYREWVDNNRTFVTEATDGRAGYLHIPNMSSYGLIEFAKAFYPQYYKEALVIDERYNGGGFTGDMIIDRLERKIWALAQPREGKSLRHPERAFHGHYVVLVNADTGSNGEYFAEAVKRNKLAKIIGMRTWGGAVGIEPHQGMLDGGMVTPPQFAPFGLDRTWLIEGYGVDPDIEVQNMPGDVLLGKDAQLEAGVEYILKRLEEDPMEIPSPPAYPDKSK